MPRVLSLVRGAAKGRPYMGLVRDASRAEGVEVAVLDGPLAPRLREILAVPAAPPRTGGLLLHAAAGDPLAAGDAAARLAAHRADGGRAVALLTGTAAQRAALEAAYAGEPGLGMANVAHVPSLDGDDGARAALDVVAEALGDDLAATARALPALRPAATEAIVARAARRAAVAAGVGIVPGAAMPVLTLLQARMVMDLAVVHDREIGMNRALELAAVVAAGFGWRALGRGAAMLVPGPAFALRGGVAYGGTRAIGEAAAKWLATGGDGADRPLDELKERIQGAVRRRRGGVGN